MNKWQSLTVASVSLIVAACESLPSEAPPGPLSYREGYSAGCDSGYRAAGHPYYAAKRDWNRYQGEFLYKLGWDEGKSNCFARYNAIL